MTTEITTPADIGEVYLSKLKVLERLKVRPYSHASERDTLAHDVDANCSEVVLTVAGRVRSIRRHGPVTFLDLVDESGAVQLLCERKTLGEQNYQELRHWLSVGDILEVRGRPGRTHTGNTTVFVHSIKLLAKCLKSLQPIRKVEERFRARSADLLTNVQARKALELRAVTVQALRTRLEREGFLEFQTPVLQPRYGGGRSQPFRTYARAHNRDMYLRITSELYLKRLVVGGFEKVYELGPCFRNQGFSTQFSPEFTMLEAYEAYAGTSRMKELVKAMVADVAGACSRSHPELSDTWMDLAGPWQELTYRQACDKYLGAQWNDHDNVEEVKHAIGLRGISLGPIQDSGSLHLKIVERLLSCYFQSPTFLSSLPVATSPLMKRNQEEPSELDRIWVFARGLFFCDIAGELTDPGEQRERLSVQRELLRSVHDYDNEDLEFMDAMLLGMPPLAGIGLGLERLVMAMLREGHIREVISFPYEMLRP